MLLKALLVYLFSLSLTRMSIFLGGQRVQLSELIFLFVFVLWLAGLIRNKRLPQETGINKPFLIFMAFCLLSFFNSSDIFLSAIELLGLIYLFVMCIMVIDIADDRKKINMIVKFWIALLTMTVALGFIGLSMSVVTGEKNIFCFYVYSKGFPYAGTRAIYRPSSVFHSPLTLANYLLVSTGFVFSELLLTKNQRYKIFLKALACSVFLLMVSLVSRELLALAVIYFLIYNYFYKAKNLKFKTIRFLGLFFIIGAFLLMMIFCSSFYIKSLKIENLAKEAHRELAINIDYAYYSRLAYKAGALEMVKRHPFLGVGLKMFRSYLQRLNDEDYFYRKNLVPILEYSKEGRYFNYAIVNDPHNDTLQYFAETGILGGCAFIFFIAAFLYQVSASLKSLPDDEHFKVSIFCFTAAFIGVLIESMDLDVFKIRHLWFLMALALALIRMHKNAKD